MSAPDSSVGAARQLAPNDPTALASAPDWRDLALEKQRFPLEVTGRLAGASWTDLSARWSRAMVTVGMRRSFTEAPVFGGKPPLGGPPLGTGFMSGEAGLRLESKGFLGPTYRSLVATIHLWVEPPLAAGTIDRPDLGHDWVVRIGSGEVLSVVMAGAHGPPFRHLHKLGDPETGFAWVPATLLQNLELGPG